MYILLYLFAIITKKWRKTLGQLNSWNNSYFIRFSFIFVLLIVILCTENESVVNIIVTNPLFYCQKNKGNFFFFIIIRIRHVFVILVRGILFYICQKTINGKKLSELKKKEQDKRFRSKSGAVRCKKTWFE